MGPGEIFVSVGNGALVSLKRVRGMSPGEFNGSVGYGDLVSLRGD